MSARASRNPTNITGDVGEHQSFCLLIASDAGLSSEP